MVVHHCFRCGYNTPTKRLWRNHLKRQKPCETKYLDIEREEVLNNYSQHLDEYLELKEESTFYKCDSCNFKTKHKRSLRRHVNGKICKKEESEVEMLKKLLEIAIQNAANNSNTNNGVMFNDESINNGIVNNMNNNINLAPYNTPVFSHITHDDWDNCIKNRYGGFTQLLDKVYENPENLNIFVRNISRNEALVFMPPDWKTMKLSDVSNHVVQWCADGFDDYMEHNKDRFSRNDETQMEKALQDIARNKINPETKKNARAEQLDYLEGKFKDTRFRNKVADNFREESGGEEIIPRRNWRAN